MRTIKQAVANPSEIRAPGNNATDSFDGGWGGDRRSMFATECWLHKPMPGGLGNPLVKISTWDGCAVKIVTTNPAPHWVLEPEYPFGEPYSARRVLVDCMSRAKTASSSWHE
jgi:hypothetical protein